MNRPMLNARDCIHGSLARKCEICDRDEEARELRQDRADLRALLTEAVRQDYGTPGWRARAIKAGCLRDDEE